MIITKIYLVLLIILQRQRYSNIENCVTNFTKIMIDLDKNYLINKEN